MSASFGRRDVPAGVPLVTEPELDTALLDYVPDSAAWTPATPKTYVSWPDSTVANPDFRLQMGGATFSGTYDPVFYQGFNVNNGNVVDATKHLATWNIEYDYNDGSKRVTEFYWEWRKDATAVRPFAAQINNTTGNATLVTDWGVAATGVLSVEGPANTQHFRFAQNAMWINYSGTAGSLVIAPKSHIKTVLTVGGMSESSGIYLYNAFSSGSAIGVNTDDNTSALTVKGYMTSQPVLTLRAVASQSGSIMEVLDSSSTVLSRFNKAGYFMTRKTDAPSDGDLAASEAAIWLDATNGAAKLMVKAKQADGTVRTGSVTLS